MENRIGSKVIIALTSYPKRIGNVYKVIESLFAQNAKVDEIILYLSEAEFPGKEQNLPKGLSELVGKNGFKIEWVEGNLKSHKKYYYVLWEQRDAVVITVDDDVIYSETMVRDLLKSYIKYPHAVSARRTRIILRDGERIAAYKLWNGYLEEYANQPRMDLCAIGLGGVLYPPACATAEWFFEERIKELAENQDDLWLKYNEIRGEIPVVYVPASEADSAVQDTDNNSLCNLNLRGGENDRCIQKLIADARETKEVVFEKWFAELMQQKEYILQKKKYYCQKIEAMFTDMPDVPVYLYGAGQRAVKILRILDDFGLENRLKGIIVSDKVGNPSVLSGLMVQQIDKMDLPPKSKVICGVSDSYVEEVQIVLRKYHCEMIRIDISGIMSYYV